MATQFVNQLKSMLFLTLLTLPAMVHAPRPFHPSLSTNLSKQEDSDQPILLYQDDIEMLTALVLYRSYLVLGAPSRLETTAANLDKFLDFMVLKHRGGGGRIRPLFRQGLQEREMGCNRLPADVQPLCSIVSSSCLTSENILKLLPMDRLDSLPRVLVRLCPLFLFRQRRPLCEHTHFQDDEQDPKQPELLEPSLERVWAFSFLFLTISIVVSMGGLMFLPFLKRDARKIILTFCEGLAVGGLTGSAVLHLFPQAFSIQNKHRTHFPKVLLIFTGVYVFYLLERALHLIALYRARNAPRRPRRSSMREDEASNLQVIARSARQRLTASERRLNELLTVDTRFRTGSGGAMGASRYSPRGSKRTISAGEATPKLLMDVYLASLSAPPRLAVEPHMTSGSIYGANTATGFGLTPSALISGGLNNQMAANRCASVQYRRHNSFFQSEPQLETLAKRRLVHDVAGRRLDQDTSMRLNIDSVAWMIVLGDASLNFIDGLSIGAAFERSILAGISISVAVMLEEVTHR